MARQTIVLAIVLQSSIALADPPLTGGPYTISAPTISSAGGTATGGLYSITSTTGEAGGIGAASNDAFIGGTLDALDSTASTTYFKAARAGGETYQNMIAAYGRPWPPDTGRTPSLDGEPASVLRYLGHSAPTYLSTGFWAVEGVTTDEFPSNVGPKLRALKELWSFEMLMGNEAFGDAMDPTIGLDGISTADLGNLFCFMNSSGITEQIQEELGLLRGRALPGTDVNWNNDTIYYPTYGSFRAAIYNKLPPNATGGDGLAYKSNYDVTSDEESVSTKFPQGHGDAYGYYLTASRAYLHAFRGTPGDAAEGESKFAQAAISAQNADEEMVDPGPSGGGDTVAVPFQAMRNMAGAMAARARTGNRIVDLTFRKDYREDPEDLLHDQILEDSDTQRAWGTADWARRAGVGAYLDWAVVNSVVPVPASGAGDELGEVHRQSMEEIGQLSAAVAEMQERVDAAGAGLNPLGLVQNVVPFGIDASGLGQPGARSHYGQVRDAAENALVSTRNVLEWANQGTQRLREQGEAQGTFVNQVAQTEADFNNRLIELFGYPSASDPADNDFDPATNDNQEASESADLVNFFMDEQAVSEQGWLSRAAPGEIQLAMSELRIAELRVDEAEIAAQNVESEIDDLVGYIEFRTHIAAQEIQVINLATEQNMSLTDALKAPQDEM